MELPAGPLDFDRFHREELPRMLAAADARRRRLVPDQRRHRREDGQVEHLAALDTARAKR